MKEKNLKLQIRILLEQNIAFGPGDPSQNNGQYFPLKIT